MTLPQSACPQTDLERTATQPSAWNAALLLTARVAIAAARPDLGALPRPPPIAWADRAASPSGPACPGHPLLGLGSPAWLLLSPLAPELVLLRIGTLCLQTTQLRGAGATGPQDGAHGSSTHRDNAPPWPLRHLGHGLHR